MTTPNYITGAATSVEIGSGDTTIGLVAESLSIDDGPGVLVKRRLGQQRADAVPGQGAGSFSASGHTTQDNLADLAALRAASANPYQVTVTYSGFTTSDATDVFDVVGTISFAVDAAGEVEWSLTGSIDSTITHTPGV